MILCYYETIFKNSQNILSKGGLDSYI